MTVTKIQTA